MSGAGTWAVVPVKELAAAKQRLAGLLGAEERRQLSLAMLADVLAALGAAPRLAGSAVVSRDTEAIGLARGAGARALSEPAGGGLNAALAFAAQALAAEGAVTTLVIPADVPLVTPGEIAELLAVHGPAPAVTLVPARDGTGTNALACSPPEAIAPRFGGRSFERHLAVARRFGIPATVLALPGLALDIDTPEDLVSLLGCPGRTRTHAYLRATLDPGSLRGGWTLPPLTAGQAVSGGRQ